MKVLLTPTPLIAFEVELGANSPYISGTNFLCYKCERGYKELASVIPLEGEHEILGFCDKGVIDFDCSSLVESWNITGVCKAYKNYKGFVEFHTDSQKSFKSLLYSHSLSLDKKYLIIKPR